MCMLCDEEAFYRAYLEHKAKLEAAGKTAEGDEKPAFAAEAVEPEDKSEGRKTPE